MYRRGVGRGRRRRGIENGKEYNKGSVWKKKRKKRQANEEKGEEK